MGLGVVIFAALPVLLYGYSFPPCIELVNTCDPLALQERLSWGVYGYYGHYPAAALGMHLYYRLTPLLAFTGCYILLRRYGLVTVGLAWVALFLISRGIAFDLRNGTFVGIINFYLWGFILVRATAAWVETRRTWVVPALLASSMVFFHAFTGLVTFAGMLVYGAVYRKPHALFLGFLLGISGAASWYLLGSSITRVTVAPEVLTALTNNSEIGALVEYPKLDLFRLTKEYIGEGALIYWAASVIVGVFAWSAGWRPKKDVAIGILVAMCLPLLFMTMSPFAVNADRTAKLLVGVITVLSTVLLVRGLTHLNDWRLSGAAGSLVVVSLVYELPQIIPYWMAMGSYK